MRQHEMDEKHKEIVRKNHIMIVRYHKIDVKCTQNKRKHTSGMSIDKLE